MSRYPLLTEEQIDDCYLWLQWKRSPMWWVDWLRDEVESRDELYLLALLAESTGRTFTTSIGFVVAPYQPSRRLTP